MDSTVRLWDVSPYVLSEEKRCQSVLYGAQHSFEKNLLRAGWSCDDT
jgi:hypothetical protein